MKTHERRHVDYFKSHDCFFKNPLTNNLKNRRELMSTILNNINNVYKKLENYNEK